MDEEILTNTKGDAQSDHSCAYLIIVTTSTTKSYATHALYEDFKKGKFGF